MSTNFLFSKVCWQRLAMFCLYTSSQLSRLQFEFSMKLKVMGLNVGYLLKSSLLYPTRPFKLHQLLPDQEVQITISTRAPMDVPEQIWALSVSIQPHIIHDHLKSEINKQITLNILFPSVCRNCCIASSTELQLKANHQCTLIYWEILRCSYCLICTRHIGIVVFFISYFNTKLLIHNQRIFQFHSVLGFEVQRISRYITSMRTLQIYTTRLRWNSSHS